jgi:hypothetical protein
MLSTVTRVGLATIIAVLVCDVAFAQESEPVPPREQPEPVDSLVQRRAFMAVGQAQLINVLVNRFDAWAFGEDWARVGPDDWWRNLRLGWEWDENEFGTNMFAHPYHGALYFNSGRSNGLDYWESVPIAFLGSFAWEYFGEKYRPSLNDFFMTSFGGIALGEMFHRVSASVRDNQATGRARTFRELAALPLDPIGGFNRLVRGHWQRVAPNPPEHTPGGYVVRVSAGARFTGDSATQAFSTADRSPTVLVDLSYGDPFRKAYQDPFDVFAVRLQVSPGGGGLNLLRASGRLYGRDLARRLGRHVFAINQRYDFLSNPAHKFGSQSVELGAYSRWQLGRESGLRTQVFVDAIFLGALDAPYSGFGERTYDFGPGVGGRTEISFERRGITYVTLYGRSEFVHSVSGAEADHFVGFGGLELTIPVAYHLSLGVHSGYYRRRSRYSDKPDETREFPELRLFLVWTGARSTAIPR